MFRRLVVCCQIDFCVVVLVDFAFDRVDKEFGWAFLDRNDMVGPADMYANRVARKRVAITLYHVHNFINRTEQRSKHLVLVLTNVLIIS